MSNDEVRLALGIGIEKAFLGEGRTCERLVRVLEQMPNVLERCAAIFIAADAALEKGLLLPTRYGSEIPPPLKDGELIADGAGDEELIAGIDRIKLDPILTAADGSYISFEEACNRGTKNPATNWGQRAAFALRDAGNAGKISKEVWPVGEEVICGKTRWRSPPDHYVYAWYVIRNEDRFDCYCRSFGSHVLGNARFVSLR